MRVHPDVERAILQAEREGRATIRGDSTPDSRSKMGNVPTIVDGERFDSKREAERWGELRMMERAGAITDLKRQVPFSIDINGAHVCNYKADFVYYVDGERRVEDVKAKAKTTKGRRATRTAVYRLKVKLMKAVLGIEVLEF